MICTCVSCYKKDIKTIFDGDVIHYAVFMYKWRDGEGCEVCSSRECPHWDYHTAECLTSAS